MAIATVVLKKHAIPITSYFPIVFTELIYAEKIQEDGIFFLRQSIKSIVKLLF